MKNFPMFLRMTGRRVVICGGGEEAARKCRLILKTDAQILIVAGDLDPELAALVASGRALHQVADEATTFDNTALAFIATGCAARDADLAAKARERLQSLR